MRILLHLKNMQKDICFIENNRDISLISGLKNCPEVIFIPLNLETFIFCKKNNFEIYDFKKNISSNFHEKTLKNSKEFINKLTFRYKLNYSLKAEITFFLRFRLHSILLIIEIIKKIKKKITINKIIVSGIQKNYHKNLHDGNLVTEIVEDLYKNEIKIVKLSDKIDHDKSPSLREYISDIQVKSDNRNVLLGNAGYNFKRIINIFNKNRVDVWIPFFEKISLLKKFYYYLYGFKPIEFKKTDDKLSTKEYIERIDFYHGTLNLSSLLNKFYGKLNFYFNDLEQKSISLKKLINNNNFSLTISNIVKGINGSILDKDIKCNTLCVSHGIIAKSYNEYDEIYKKIIAEAVFSGESRYFAIQSKIMNDSLKTHNLNGKVIKTGNIVFSSIKNSIFKKKYVLQASTVKNFTNLQFLGVEMFYEYWDLLLMLNRIAKKNFLNILVKPHPTIKNCTNDLKKNFTNIKFSNSSIDKLLRKSSLLISYSSSSIEDALNSKIPVILFEKDQRYIHVKPFENIKTNSAIKYLNSEEKLISQIKQNKNNSYLDYDFDEYIYSNKNIEKNILSLI